MRSQQAAAALHQNHHQQLHQPHQSHQPHQPHQSHQSHQPHHLHHAQLQQMQFVQEVTINDNSSMINLNPAETNGRIVTISHPNNYASHTLCRQVAEDANGQPSRDSWGNQLFNTNNEGTACVSEQLTEEDRNLAAALVQFVSRQPLSDFNQIAKAVVEKSDSEACNGLIDHPIRLYQSPDVNIEDVELVIEEEANGAAQTNNKQNKKSLPHKKRLSKKLKKHTFHNAQLENEHDAPDDAQQVMGIIQENVSNDIHSGSEHTFNAHHMVCGRFVSDFNIKLQQSTLPAGFVQEKALFICQLCGEFYGRDQLQFFHHLRQHYEPNNASIMLDTIQHDDNAISIDKIDESLVVANAPLPDSLVELSLDDTNKTLLYQSQAKLSEYDGTEKSLSNSSLKNSLYSLDDKVTLFQSIQKHTSYTSPIDKMFACTQCPKTFKRQKLFEAHTKDAHSKTEEMSEFSDTEDLMEGIHVVEPENEEFLQDDLSSQHSNGIMLQTNMKNQDQYILPHLIIHDPVNQSHLNPKWLDPFTIEDIPKEAVIDMKTIDVVENNEHKNPDILMDSKIETEDDIVCPTCIGILPTQKDYQAHSELCQMHLKEDLQNIIDVEIENNDSTEITESEPPNNEVDFDEESEEIEEDKIEMNVFSPNDKKPILTCVDCGKQFRSRNSILYHMLSHVGKKPFECEVCKKGFFTAFALKVHSRLHSGVRPYNCSDCGKKFRQWGDLKYHYISIHSNLKLHQCEYCGKNFARKYSLIVHRRIHTGEKNYRCEFCDKTFRASSYLQNHRKIHTGEKPYPCEICGKKFRMKGDMRRHIKHVHNKTKTPDKAKDQIPEKNANSSSTSTKLFKDSKSNSTPLQDTRDEMKIEKEEAQIETENDDNSVDVKGNVTNEEANTVSSTENAQEDKINSNFPLDNSTVVYNTWSLFLTQ